MSEASLLDGILERLGALPESERAEVVRSAFEATADYAWVPNPGPQTEAYFCEADELFYGGEAGGGKSDLLIGLSLTAHRRSLVMRRTNKEAGKLFDRYAEIIGNTEGQNKNEGWRYGRRTIDIGGCQLEADKQKRKGIPHDLKGFDEVSDFTESQYLFITGWTRSEDQDQRCRIVATGNPPTRPEGLWVIRRWAAWLDPHHPNPAKPGELRWYVRDDEDHDVEVPGPGVHEINGHRFTAKSRTFIRSKLSDNPDLARTDYAATLDALPKELRDAYRDGRFDAGIKDHPMQAIPTDWVREAQARWTPTPPQGIPMCALGIDPAAGGADETTVAHGMTVLVRPDHCRPGRPDAARQGHRGAGHEAPPRRRRRRHRSGRRLRPRCLRAPPEQQHPGDRPQGRRRHHRAHPRPQVRVLQQARRGLLEVPRGARPRPGRRLVDRAAPGSSLGRRSLRADLRGRCPQRRERHQARGPRNRW
jgi:hypothetical protein